MKFTELKADIAVGAKSVYLLEGDDAYFRAKGEEMIKSAFLQMPELNFTSFEGENLKGGGLTSLVSAVRNFPFMTERRVIKVSEFYPAESEYDSYLKSLFEDFPPSSILIIVNTGAKNGADLKRRKSVTYVDCNRADRETVAKWAYVTLKRAGVKAAVGLCESIADYCLCNMARVSVEVDKLIAYKGGGELTKEDIDGLVYKDADYRIYELTNSVPRRDYTLFCTIADELCKKDGDEMLVLGGLMNYFRNLTTIISSRSGDKELADMLKMKEYGVKKSREQALSIGEQKLRYLTEYVYKQISDMKCGLILPKNALQNTKNAIFFADK